MRSDYIYIFSMAQQPLVGQCLTIRHTTLGRTPLDELSTPHRELYLTTHNTHNRQTSMPLAAFKPAIPASERPQNKPWTARPLGSAKMLDTKR